MIHIIEKVIKNDILNELLKNYEKYNCISIEEYIQFCENRIDIYIKQIVLDNNIKYKLLKELIIEKLLRKQITLIRKLKP